MSNFTNFPKNESFIKPTVKALLAERCELVEKRKNTRNLFERMKLSSQIADIDKQIIDFDFKTK